MTKSHKSSKASTKEVKARSARVPVAKPASVRGGLTKGSGWITTAPNGVKYIRSQNGNEGSRLEQEALIRKLSNEAGWQVAAGSAEQDQ
jgi:hypothetical protein